MSASAFVLTETPCPNSGGRLVRSRTVHRSRRPTLTVFLYGFKDPSAAHRLAERVGGAFLQGNAADEEFEAAAERIMEEAGLGAH